MASFFLIPAIFLTCICFSVCLAETMLLPLTHSFSTTHFDSTNHLLKSTSARSVNRFRRHHHRGAAKGGQVFLPLSPGSDYTISITVNSHPPQSVSLYMDTGSDVVWVPCAPFTCILCEGKPRPRHAVLNVSSVVAPAVSCQSSACAAAHSPLSSPDLCAMAKCPLDSIEMLECSAYPCPPFYFAYGDGSFIGRLLRHTVSIPMSSPGLTLPNFTFGCAHSALGEPVGVAGFGRGVLSLPSQLSTLSPQLGKTFSYCLVSHSFDADQIRQPSPLILGQERKSWSDFVFTPILENPNHPYFYTVGLEGVSVGKKKIPVPEILRRVDSKGNGGMVVDSGTTFTMLHSTLYNSLVAEFDRQLIRVHKRAPAVEEKTGLAPCYYISGGGADVPAMALRFVGSKGSDVVLPRSNYFYEFTDGGDGAEMKRKVGCLMLMDGGDDAELNGGPAATLGNYQQQGFEVVYDIGKKRVGFARRHCASLWDSLRQH